MAKRSYPTSEVRGSGRECQAATVQKWRRGATPRRRSGAKAKRSYPMQEARGGSREEQPTSKERWLPVQEGLEELFHVQGQKGQR